MGKRSTVYNNLVQDKWSQVNKENKALLDEWLQYLHSVDRSQLTIDQYENDFKIWAVWNLEFGKDKFFVDMTKRDVINFQGYCLKLGHSSSRVRRLRSTVSSLSNYIENILDDEYPTFRNIINKIEAPKLEKVREKLVLEEEQITNTLDTLLEEGQYQMACYFALGAYSGSRKSELLRFKVDYFDESFISDGLYKTPEKIKTKGRGKAGKPLNKYTIVVYFKPFLEAWLEERKKLGIESEWLFVSYNGENKSWEKAEISTANSWASRITKILGESFYAHSLRHYYTTSLHKAGIPAEAIKEINGWESVE